MAGSRYGLTDFEWSVIKEALPRKGRCAPRVDDRRVLNGIFVDKHSALTPENHPKSKAYCADRRV